MPWESRASFLFTFQWNPKFCGAILIRDKHDIWRDIFRCMGDEGRICKSRASDLLETMETSFSKGLLKIVSVHIMD